MSCEPVGIIFRKYPQFPEYRFIPPIQKTAVSMSFLIRILSTLFTSIPAFVWLTLIFLAGDDDYFWIVYRMVGVIFLLASLSLGGIVPGLFSRAWRRRPEAWIAGQGTLAWLAGLVALGVLNLTPLCIGQDNGDGNNDLALCMVQTTLVGFVYSFPQIFLLALSAIPGGLLIKKLLAS
jgi:hypothetical protein